MITKFIGLCVINLYKALKAMFQGKISFKRVIFQASVIGYDSLPIALTIAMVAGAVLSLQVSQQFALTGADSYIGGLVSLSLTREMAPIFAALAIGARAGTAMAAEIGNMQVTEQIDALTVLKVDPISYILVPRLLAGLIVVPLVTILAEFIGIVGGMFVANNTVALHPSLYIKSVWLYTNTYDIKASLVKAAVFGVLISLIAVTNGLETRGGAKEVGLSTTKAAICTAIAIPVFDLLLSWMFFA